MVRYKFVNISNYDIYCKRCNNIILQINDKKKCTLALHDYMYQWMPCLNHKSKEERTKRCNYFFIIKDDRHDLV